MKRVKLILAFLGATLMLNAQYRPLNKDSVIQWKKAAYRHSLTLSDYFLCQQNQSGSFKVIDTILNTSGASYAVGDMVGVKMSFPNFAPSVGTVAKVTNVAVFNDTLGSAGLFVHLYNGALTGTFVDNSACVVNKGQLYNWMNSYSMSANVMNTGQTFVASGGTGAVLREFVKFNRSTELTVLVTASGSGTYNRGRVRLLIMVQFL